MSNPKEIAVKLLATAIEKKVRFPKIFDESQLIRECGAMLMTTRKDGVFDEEEALSELISKHGVEETQKEKEKKRKSIEEDDINESKVGDEVDEDKPAKKAKRANFACEDNREVGEAIMEMAGIYFKNSDARKGGVFSKAAKAIRDCEFKITTKKEAMSLKGVGKGIASYIEEYLESKMIVRLEEMRAGQA